MTAGRAYTSFAVASVVALGATGAWSQSQESKRIMANVVQPLLNATCSPEKSVGWRYRNVGVDTSLAALLILKHPERASDVCAVINKSLAEARIVRKNSDAHSWELPNGNAELTQLCGKEKSSTGHAFPELWRSKAALTLSELSAGESRVALATWLATSNLPLNDRQEVLGWGSADTWALPCVASLLLPALPSTERERLEQLPLATHPDDAEALNRALFQLYCPEMYPLMELAMTDGDWCARETIESWVTRLENIETEAFALPPDSPENNMAN